MIYLDNAATTKPDTGGLKAAEKYILENYFNPSALYADGYNVHRALKDAANNVLSVICNSAEYELIFTSGGTEADNTAVFGGGKRGNIVTTMGEHSAVFAAVNELKQRGLEVRFADLNADGSVNAESLLSLIDEKTSLVSVIHINNETGAVNDVVKLSTAVKLKNKFTLFHSDGIQAFGKIPFKITKDIDMYSVSAHKIGGLKGCGALIKKKNIKIKPLIYGGGQQNGMRSGTENVFAIKNFEYCAIKRYAELTENFKKVSAVKSVFVNRLDNKLFKFISSENSSPYILCVGAYGVRGETILHEANDNGLLIGTGSACSSNDKKRYSRIILACGIGETIADGILRLSFSPENTVEEAERAAEILNMIVANRKKVMG